MPPDTKAPPPQGLSAAQVEQQIQDKLNSEPALANTTVGVKTDDKSVTLTGRVDTERQHDLALRIAQSYAGDRKIVDKIKIRGQAAKVEGCLQGSNGNFTLTDSSGTTYQLQGDTSKLAEHVGHEVQITGSASGPSAASTSAGTAGGGSQQTLDVKSVKHISKACKSTGT